MFAEKRQHHIGWDGGVQSSMNPTHRLLMVRKVASQIWRKKLHDIPLSKDRYNLRRKSFATITGQDIDFFERTLPTNNQVLRGETEAAGYNRDYFRYVRGMSSLVLKPRSAQEVSSILKYCNGRRLAISIFGGNTGVCGGSVPVFDEIVLSLELMNRVESIDRYSGTMLCEAGCILGKLEQNLSEEGLMLPLDLGSKDSCQIGGNVSTNAGGIRLMRYGNLHGSILGLEVVLADGTVLDLMSTSRKDNTGYHLKNLFIGAEGSLGVVTKVAISCPPATVTQNVLFLGLKSYEHVLKTFLEAKKLLGGILTSCELIDHSALDCCINHLETEAPLGEFPFYLLIETTGQHKEHDDEKVEIFLGQVLSTEMIQDGIMTSDPSKIKTEHSFENIL
ncbi:D-2-hydroxyglutarate dehydrogenase, mitochondrial-like [Uranotaenia lowii]|uniref:D-2-hydroxyglutarate dehydrogenase, mitochondrial-like n=1 Tax=Uranotaenia lowii TaxID=190385 RepID=UPI002479C88D|nr:D-2-hydroxyglutarate dehydrogenase, mitochondrial-like [Uranotaenia lowii]